MVERLLIYRWSLIIAGLIVFNQATAQINTPSYTNEFLNIGTGARGLAMGNAQVANPLPGESGYWNPSFLSSLNKKYYLSLMHSEYFGGVASYDYLSYAISSDSISGFSVSLIRLGVDDIPDTRLLYDANGVIDYDAVTFFSAVDMAFLFSYGRKMDVLGGINVGGSAKIIRRKVGEFGDAWGFGLDVGLNKSFDKITAAVTIRDITGTFTNWQHDAALLDQVYQSTGNTISSRYSEVALPQVIAGIALNLIQKEKWELHGQMDARLTSDGARNTLISGKNISIDPALGLEFILDEKVFIRTGLNKWQQEFISNKWVAEWSTGLGFAYKNIQFQYALNRNNGFDSNHYTHSFSLNAKLKN